MAKPAKRRVEGSGSDATGPSRGATSKRVTAKTDRSPAGRYTPPRTGAGKGPSPRWVPVLMFTLWGVGLLVIVHAGDGVARPQVP